MGRGVSTMEPWTLGMVGWVAGGVCHSQKKRFLNANNLQDTWAKNIVHDTKKDHETVDEVPVC